MSANLLVWKWSADYDTPAKRRRLKVKFDTVTSEFADTEDSPAFGDFDLAGFLAAVDELYPQPEEERPFFIEHYDRCLCFSIPNSQMMEVIPRIGQLAMSHGLNGSQF